MAWLLITPIVILELVGLGNWGPTASLARHAASSQTAPALENYTIASTPSGSTPELNLTTNNALVIDAATGQVLYAKNPDARVPIASVTKMFTILMVLKDHSLDETVTIPTLPSYEPGAVLLGAPTGAKFKLGDLVKAALIPSDNDAADALAIYDAGSVPAFIAKMNQLMKDWDLSNVHFVSANGLVDANNYATARSLGLAARLLLTNSSAQAITSSQTDTIRDSSGRAYSLNSTNELLQEPNFYGIKTGYTPLAGQCLVAGAIVHGHKVISVVLGSQDRFGETKKLIEGISQGYSWP